MSNSKEKEAAGTLEKLIESLRQVGIVVSDFESQEALNKLLNDTVSHMGALDGMKDSLRDVMVPVDILDFIDKGENPDLRTRQVFEDTLTANLQVNGKAHAFEAFHGRLHDALSKTYPDASSEYLQKRAAATTAATERAPQTSQTTPTSTTTTTTTTATRMDE